MERYELANGDVYEIRHSYGHSNPDDYDLWKIHPDRYPFLAYQGSYRDCYRFAGNMEKRAMF